MTEPPDRDDAAELRAPKEPPERRCEAPGRTFELQCGEGFRVWTNLTDGPVDVWVRLVNRCPGPGIGIIAAKNSDGSTYRARDVREDVISDVSVTVPSDGYLYVRCGWEETEGERGCDAEYRLM